MLRSQEQELCLGCHNATSKASLVARDIATEMSKGGHVDAGNDHQSGLSRAADENQSRHAACSDCHDSHQAKRVDSFTPPPMVRASQLNVAGVSALDGTTVVKAAAQYEICFRCHNGRQPSAAAAGQYGYRPLRQSAASAQPNFVLQFGAVAGSSHPVTHSRSSSLPQPSLLPVMTLLDGKPQGRAMGSQIFCTDCHNSDDNREFGGAAANGPHGSRFSHILERRYEMSEAPIAGLAISNPLPNPDLTAAGPYALCAKCHDLQQVLSNSSFSQHSSHINAGFSCSVCHSAHGVARGTPAGNGERLVDFDMSVVARVASEPVSYNRQTQTCSLSCHGHSHALQR